MVASPARTPAMQWLPSTPLICSFWLLRPSSSQAWLYDGADEFTYEALGVGCVDEILPRTALLLRGGRGRESSADKTPLWFFVSFLKWEESGEFDSFWVGDVENLILVGRFSLFPLFVYLEEREAAVFFFKIHLSCDGSPVWICLSSS